MPQALFDALSGAAGHPVNRPGLEAFVANSQSINGLRSAQTEDALLRAQQAREEMQASDDLEQSLGAIMAPSDAHAAATVMKAKMGNAKVAMDALTQNLELKNRTTLSDPTQLNSPNQTAAQQGIQGKVATPEAVPSQFATLPGMDTPNVQQTPAGAAETHLKNSQADLASAQAANPEMFHPHSGAMPLAPEQQQKLTTLMGAGILSPSQLYSFSRNPSLIDAAFGAYQQDPTALAGLAHAKQALVTNITSGVMGRGLVSLNTAVSHMGLVPQTIQALNNGNVTVLNSLFNGLNAQTGTPAPILAKQLAQFLGREVVNAVQSNGGGEREREAAQDIFAPANSPETLQQAAQQAAQLLSGRAHSVEQDYVGTMSLGQTGSEEQYRQQFRKQWLTPETRRIVGMGSADIGLTPSATTPGAAPPVAQPPAPGVAPPAQVAPMTLEDYLRSKGH